MQFRAVLFMLACFLTSVLAVRNGKATYYAPGLGSCGMTNNANQHVVAVSSKLFDSFPGATANPNKNPVCGKRIKIRHGNKVVYAKVVDRCPGCKNLNDLDLSPKTFKALGVPLSKGHTTIRWHFA